MTPQDLDIYRLKVRVTLLEHLLASVAIGLIAGAGGTPQSARSLLVDLIEQAQKKISAGPQPDPALYALHHDETSEIVSRLKELVSSYQ